MAGPNRYTEGLLEIGDAVASTLASNGEIRVNVGDATLGTGIDSSVPFWGTDGFLARPSDPTAAGAAQFLFYADGNQRYAVGSRDRRFLAQAGTLDPGDRVVYTSTGVRIHLDASAPAIVLRAASTCTATLSPTSLDVVGSGSAENVALYAMLQAYESAMQTYVTAVQAALLAILPVALAGVEPPPPAPPGPLTSALTAAFTALTIAQTNATNAALASSSVLRASPL